MPDLFADVAKFHKKFDLPQFGTVHPNALEPDVRTYREQFLLEELTEYIQAPFIEDMADALVDLVYVALGTAHMMGIDFNAHWAEVQRANMAKERALSEGDTRSKRRHSLDVVKPEGWQPPNHVPILAQTIINSQRIQK